MSLIKRMFLLVISIVVFASLTFAMPTENKKTLTFTAPTTNADGSPLTDLEGVKVYWSTASGGYSDSQSYDIGEVQVGEVRTIIIEDTIGVLQGTYYFVVTAYDVSRNESGFSNEVSADFLLLPAAPEALQIN